MFALKFKRKDKNTGMAKLTSIVQFTGTLGKELTAYECNGKVVIRKKSTKRRKRSTAPQRTQNNKVKLVNAMLKGSAPIMKFTFAEVNPKYPFAAAGSYNVRNAVVGEVPDQTIDYDLVRVGGGSLPGAENAVFAMSDDSHSLFFEWDYDECCAEIGINDIAMPVAYNVERQRWAFCSVGAQRSAGRCCLQLPTAWEVADTVAWLCFRTDDGSRTSNSVRCRIR